MASLLFGTGGTPHSSKTNSTIDGIRRIAELELDCMEIEFVQGVRMGEAGARLVAEVTAKEGVKLSAHAPYFMNFNAHEPEKIRASQDRLLQTARIAASDLWKSAASIFQSVENSDLVGIALVLIALGMIAHRLRRRAIQRHPDILLQKECPKCHGDLHRRQRKLLDRLLELILWIRVRRYYCAKCSFRATVWKSRREVE